jgi:ABC-type nickel/cobalt efflux system permease component RcnA
MAAGAPKEGARVQSGKVSARQLLVLGITGGMVPCPAALVVLLSAVALHRTGFGLFLIVAFSIGLAAVLIAMGFVAVYAGRMASRLPIDGPLVQRWLPMGSAVMITALGCVIAVRGLMAAGIVPIQMWF